ncbi:Arylphorin subunit alpha [Habropoda laboriosa]|uniref:Arylphorin subunit alpha n=2 Tax=Habropoda laboriosa TaxID=597456 RepID=A0A0L7RE83_9HYME|nr:Arylphorin subunit alpha [Habropoda laboriosa]
MKPGFLILASFCLLAQAAHLPADKSYLVKQKNIYELFWHVDQPTIFHSELNQKSRTFDIVANVDNYNDREAVNEFVQLLKTDMLPRGQVFSSMDPQVQRQTVVLFRVLYSAKDFEMFYNTAVWARFHVNELMYVYALSAAVIQRPDTKFIKLPPLYEVLPHFFFNEEVMQKAYNIAMGDNADVKKNVGGIEYHVIPTNYSGWYVSRENDPEQRMTYYTEDIGLNSLYFLINHHIPPFMPTTTPTLQSQTRGEYYFFIHKQLLARYHLERLANDLGEVNYVDIDRPIPTGYYPTMHFRNGLPFPQRETGALIPLSMMKYILMIKDHHHRISTSIDLGYVVDNTGKHINIYKERNGLNVLGNIVQGNADTVNKQFYGQIDLNLRKVLGFGLETNVKYQVVPSALQIFCTSMRDPVFYSMYKNILTYYNRYKENLPRYTTEELSFPGVRIESVTVDKLITYFDNFESMLNNGVSIRSHKEAKNIVIKSRQSRLTHKPFTYHITLNSDKTTKAMLRIFLGPKCDEFGRELNFEHTYINYVQLDEWVADLKTGSNTIDRSSHDSQFVVPDEVPSDVFYKKIVSAIEGTETIKYSTQPYGLPERLLLPKGKKEGMQYKLLVVVSPIEESTTTSMYGESPIWGRFTHDGRAMGFPLDRPVNNQQFDVPNIHTSDVMIYHKAMRDLNIPL